VNIVTRAAELGRSNAQCETRIAHGSRSLDAGAYRAAGRVMSGVAMGFEVGRVESSGADDGTDLATESAHAAARVETGLGRLKLDAGYAGRGFGTRGFFTDAPASGREETRTRTFRASLDTEILGWSLGTSLSARAHHDDFMPDAADLSAPHTLSDTDVFRLRVTAHHSLLGGDLVVGAEAARERVHASYAVAGRDHGALFLEAARAFSNDAPARGGAHLALRLDSDEGFGSRVTPRASLWFTPVPAVRLRASGGLAYRLPTFSELYGADARAIGDPALGAETARGAEVGVAADAGPVSFDVSAFLRRGRHVIDGERVSFGVPVRVVARERLDVDGLAARVSLSRALPPIVSLLALQVNVLSVKTDAPPAPGGLLDPVHLRWDALVGLAHASSRLHAFTRLSYGARRAEGGIFTQDARLGWQTVQGDILEVYLEGENLWNKDLEEEPGVRLAGRRLVAGFHLTW